jgi:hypothetical protein
MKPSSLVSRALLIVALTLPAVAIAGPEFLTYEGRDAVHEGQGGEKKTVDGVDFWMSGDPPHRYEVLGSLTDRRHESGLYGAIRMSSLDDDIAKAAKANGGDAVILQAEDNDVIGVASTGTASAYATGGPGWANANGFGSRFSRPIEAHDSRYLVIKYLTDPPPPAPAPTPGPAGP